MGDEELGLDEGTETPAPSEDGSGRGRQASDDSSSCNKNGEREWAPAALPKPKKPIPSSVKGGRRRRSSDASGAKPRSVFSRSSSLKSSINFYSEEPEVDYWMPPPPVDDDDNALIHSDAPITVDFRCACFKLSDISTVDFTTLIKFVIVFEWTDPRLRGMPITTNDLPGDLWGPDIILENAQNDCAVIYDSFSLLDADIGRLKRTVTFHGHVYNPMDLKRFPFDDDDLTLKFISICNWRTLDGSRHGNDPVNRIYTLSPMLDRDDVGFFTLGWGGKINEFMMLGYTENVVNPDTAAKPIVFKFDIHLVRKAGYYILKILVPLWLIVLTSLASFAIAADDLQGRLEVIFTLLLSTIALLYVVQESIPKISFLTIVDKIVILTLLSLSLSVLFSCIVSRPQSAQWNSILAGANQAFYWSGNIALLAPPYYRYRNHVAKVGGRQQFEDTDSNDKEKRKKLRRSTFSFKDSALVAARNVNGSKDR